MVKYFASLSIKRLSPFPYPLKLGCLVICFDKGMWHKSSRLSLKELCSFHLRPLRMFLLPCKEYRARLLKRTMCKGTASLRPWTCDWGHLWCSGFSPDTREFQPNEWPQRDQQNCPREMLNCCCFTWLNFGVIYQFPWAARTNYHKPGFILTLFWRSEVEKSRCQHDLLPLKPLGKNPSRPLLASVGCWQISVFLGIWWHDSNLYLCLHLASSLCISVALWLFSEGHQWLESGSTLIQCDLIFTWLQLQRPYFQNKMMFTNTRV